MGSRGFVPVTAVDHGTRGAYNHHRCRCVDCTAANTDYIRRYRTDLDEPWVCLCDTPTPNGLDECQSCYRPVVSLILRRLGARSLNQGATP